MFDAILHAPCYIINMDRCSDRLAKATTVIHEAGFHHVMRWKAVDATVDDLTTAWAVHGSPVMSDDPDFYKYLGEQGCALSHLNLWKHIIDTKIPTAVVFEDDVSFHKDWHTLAPQYYTDTPKDWDILYLGSQIDGDHPERVLQTHVYCAHAYVITLEGARRVYDYITKECKMYAIDSMLRDGMLRERHPFTWYVWNGMMYPDMQRGSNPHWVIRNTGLVFQDETAGTFLKPRL